MEYITQKANREPNGKGLLHWNSKLNDILKLPKCMKLCHFVQIKMFHRSITCESWIEAPVSCVLSTFFIDTETEVQENNLC